MNKLFLLLLPLLLTASFLAAQPDGPPNEGRPPFERADKPEQRGARFGQIRAARKAYLTEQLALTEEEAAAFFPVYWAFDEQTRKAKRATNENYRNRAKNGPLTEIEAQEVLLLDRTLRQEMLTLRKKTNFSKSYLPPRSFASPISKRTSGDYFGIGRGGDGAEGVSTLNRLAWRCPYPGLLRYNPFGTACVGAR